jgi:hypothetical protein
MCLKNGRGPDSQLLYQREGSRQLRKSRVIGVSDEAGRAVCEEGVKKCAGGHVRSAADRPREQSSRMSGGRPAVRRA